MAEWEIFPEIEDTDSEEVQNAILDAILGFSRYDGCFTAGEDNWQAKSNHWAVNPLHQRWPWFAEHLIRSRRFIIAEDPSGEIVRPERWVPGLLKNSGAVLKIKKSTRLYRGRLRHETAPSPRGCCEPLPVREMGAPPPRLAKAGRANPDGISFLYCALEMDTAIVETGRFPGAVVSLREVRVRKPLRLADLRGRKDAIEPLATPNLAAAIEEAVLLNSLGRALATPVHPEDSSAAYAPTQYLAEVIRSAGYDGICYPSALKPNGANIVIFEPQNVRVTRQGWIFKLGKAEYTIHPNPDFSRKRWRRRSQAS